MLLLQKLNKIQNPLLSFSFFLFLSARPFSNDSHSLYSFLKPSIFTFNKNTNNPLSQSQEQQQQLTISKSEIESQLQESLETNSNDDAWKAFKTLTSHSLLPGKHLTNSLITTLSCFRDAHNVKRAFTAVLFILERDPQIITPETVQFLMETMRDENMLNPALALVRETWKRGLFVDFGVWCPLLIELGRKNGNLVGFYKVLEESCRIVMKNERLDHLKPDVVAFNAALEGCCFELKSVKEASAVMELMSVVGIEPNEESFALLGFLYASEGVQYLLPDLDKLMAQFDVKPGKRFYGSLIKGYLNSGDLVAVYEIVLRALREAISMHQAQIEGENRKPPTLMEPMLDQCTYVEIAKGFLGSGRFMDLARLIMVSQELEEGSVSIDSSVGACVIHACLELGMLYEARNILSKINAQGAMVGIDVHTSVLKAYCREHRTAEAAELVGDISSSGLRLDESTYDSLIDVAMAAHDFQSAFLLFRDMREARIPNLKISYLTIMTGLMESHKPELMISFLNEIVKDPRIEVSTHDWNSIIHSFCKVRRLEDAKRTLRRMVVLRFEPNEQTYLSLVNGYSMVEDYSSVSTLWTEVRKQSLSANVQGIAPIKFDRTLVDAFLYSLIKGGLFGAAMQVIEKANELKIYVDKFRYKQLFMETQKQQKRAKIRRKNFRQMDALVAFKSWAGLTA